MDQLYQARYGSYIITAYMHSEPEARDANIDYCWLARDETRSAVNSLLKVAHFVEFIWKVLYLI